jgi:lipopolysaccharide export system protein LptA
MSTNIVLFNGIDANGLASLWETDGTAAGTWEVSVTGISSPVVAGVSTPQSPGYITAFGSEALFSGGIPVQGNSGQNLWITDGTSPGTSEISVPGNPQVSKLVAFGSEALFEDSGTNLWVTNGTSAGTSKLTVNGANTVVGLNPQHVTPFGSKALFMGLDSNYHENLWVTDGTSGGTSELTVVGASSTGLFAFGSSNFGVLGSEALFEGADTSSTPGLWVTDGTSSGTSEVLSFIAPTDLVTFGTKILFASSDGSLRVSDGTASGTSEIVTGLAVPQDLTVFGNKVLFVAGSPTSRNLWVTDGTAAGTSEITVAGAGPEGLFVQVTGQFFSDAPLPPGFVVLGSEVLFAGQDANGGLGLWVTDGTPAGTSELSVAGALPTLPNIFPSGLSPASLAVFTQNLIQPVLSNVPGNGSYTERSAPVTLAPSLRPSDTNSTTLASATVSIAGGTFANDGDVLAATTAGTGITATYYSTTETLTLTGTDTLADYQLVLDSITFASPSHNPTNYGSDPTRTLTWVVDDGTASNNLSAPQTTTLSITPVNDPPMLSNVATTFSFTEHNGPIAVLSPNVSVTDPDSLNLVSATVRVTGGTFAGGTDVLSAPGIGSISVSYNSSTETLTLTGTDTLAHYQNILDTVAFISGENPTNFGSNPTRTVTWTLNDGSASNGLSTPVTETISITNVNDPPTLSNVAATATVWEVGQTVTLSPALAASDPDSLTLAGATVSITGGTFAGDCDVLAATTTGTGITASYNSSTETLTLTGSDTIAHYSQVLDSVTFNSTSGTPTNFGSNATRTLSWVVNDGGGSNNLSAPTTTTISISLEVRNDFTGDGDSDLLFQNTNGTPQIWLMNGTSIASQTTLAAVPSSWHVIGTGEVNGDGKADIIWQNSDGTPAVWEMNGTSLVTAATLPAVPPSWHIIATGDFNNDGKADLMWQNTDGTPAIWEMNGTSIVSAVALTAVPPSWRVVGAGDFNGDGHADILWQNTDGTPAVWEMNGTSIANAATLPAVPPEWKIVGTGDFNDDGKTDILWVDTKTNTPAIWEMNGTSIVSAVVLPAAPSSWTLIGTSDFNGDGKADIIWQNSDGTPGIWEMNGTSIASAAALTSPGAAWQIKNDGPIPPDQMGTGAGGAMHLSAPDAAHSAGAGAAELTLTTGATTVANSLHIGGG